MPLWSRRQRRRLRALGWLLLANALILGAAALVRQAVLPAWKKGPLIDPAAPYAPENAQLLFALGFCVVFNTYVLLLGAWRQRRAARPLVAWVALALALLVGEGALRAWVAFDAATYFRPDPVLHWVVRGGLHDYPDRTSGTVVTTNADGMREVHVPRDKPPGARRVLVLGDSSAFGLGVSGRAMGSAVLQELLAPLDPGVQVLNGACPGWTTWQALPMLEAWGWSYGPDLVLAGFNNDPGPEYLGDEERAAPPGWRRAALSLAFASELFLVGREATLSLLRRLSPEARARFAERRAGDAPTYGRLAAAERRALVPRVPRERFLDNLRALAEAAQAHGARFAWIDMPVNRAEPELALRYVDWSYRAAARELDIPVIEVDDAFARSRETGLFLAGHLFHPSEQGHRRWAEVVARAIASEGWLDGLAGEVTVGGPPPARTRQELRLGWSSLTPVHAHVGVVLSEHPELAREHGVELVTRAYASGREQGDVVRDHALDAFFTCEVPAVNMLRDRPDARVVASPGVLGRIAVVSRRARTLAGLAGARVGLARGSTPAMDWERWGAALEATVADLPTEQLEAALLADEVDAVVSWDPWVEAWLQAHPEWHVVAERPFWSVLAVSVPWVRAQVPGDEGWPADRLARLVEAALRLAAADRARVDARVAELSGWPVAVVRAVADRNAILAGREAEMALPDVVGVDLARASAWVGGPPAGGLLAPELRRGATIRLRDDGAAAGAMERLP